MSNRSVSLASYVACVEAQIAFLEGEGYVRVRSGENDFQECYERNVSVDACAMSVCM